MPNNPWLTGTLLSFIVLAVCLIALAFALRWFRPSFKIGQWLGALTVGMAIVAMASFNLLGERDSGQLPRQAQADSMYKMSVWLEQEQPDFALKQAKKLWADIPSTDSKIMLGLAYLNAGQMELGTAIVQEAREENRSTPYLKAAEITALAQNLPARNASEKGTEEAANDAAARASSEGAKLLRQKIGQSLGKDKAERLELLAQLDPDRLQYALKETADGGVTEAGVEQLLQQAMQEETDDPQEKNALAQAAIYLGDEAAAQTLLVELLQDYPEAEEPAAMLGDLLLNGDLSTFDPELWQSLPQYKKASLLAERDQQRVVKEWTEEVRSGDEEAANVAYGRIRSLPADVNLNKHLAYAILGPMESSGDPEVSLLLSRYYYAIHEEERSSELIRSIADDPSRLTTAQQYYVQALRELPKDPAEQTLQDIQTRNELTTEVYRSFRPIEGKRLNERELSNEERSYAVHLSNQLIQLRKTSIRISSVHATDDGNVDLYVTADNIDDLKRSDLSILDNNLAVRDFKMDKIGESTSYERNILMIMDRSGSMGDGSRLPTAKLAVQNFLDGLHASERAGVLLFSDTTEVLSPISGNVKSTRLSVGTVEANGGTSIAPAFDAGIEMLSRESGERVIFMLSDGEDDQFSDPNTRADIIKKANQAGITVFAIGFGAGYETLRDVAEATGGSYIGASELEDLINSFDEISQTLQRSYHISYKLSPMTVGKHKVVLTGPGQAAAERTYEIGGAGEEDGSIEAMSPAPEIQSVDYALYNAVPSGITASKLGMTKLIVNGIGLSNVKTVQLDGKKVSLDSANDKQLSVTFSNNQSIGIHKLALIHKDGRQLTTNLSVTNSAGQQSRNFGFATIYGDFIDAKGNDVVFRGNTSVDHFLYDTGGVMEWTGNKELSFSGLHVNVQGTHMGLLPSVTRWVSNAAGSLPWNVKIEAGLNSRSFDVSLFDKGEELQKFSSALDKFGIEAALGSMSYEAGGGKDDGKLKVRTMLVGFDDIMEQLNSNALDDLKKRLKFMPTDFDVVMEYEPDNMAIEGESAVDLDLGTLIKGVSSVSVGYGFMDGKLDLGGEVEEGKLFGYPLEMDNPLFSIDTFGLKLGWQGSIMPKAVEVGVEGDAKIANTGLVAHKAKLGADFRSGFSGVAGLQVGTITDGPFKEVVDLLNKLPMIDIDEEDACVLCLEGEAEANEIGTADWSISGQLELTALGFDVASQTTYVDAHQIQSGLKINRFGLEGDMELVWRNPQFTNDTTFQIRGGIDYHGLEAQLVAMMDVSNFKRSYVDLKADTWLYDPHIHIGAKIQVYS